MKIGSINGEIRRARVALEAAGERPTIDHPKLRALYEQRWAKRAEAKEAKRKRKARRVAKKKMLGKVKVTRSVSYTYDERDNGKLKEFYKSKEWKFMRYEALRRYGGRCQCCGASAQENAGLHVDHIKPLRVFWDLRLDIDNLQVLCADCNEGKGARHADDWRTNAP